MLAKTGYYAMPINDDLSLSVGLAPSHPCSYLPAQQEQVVVVMDDDLLNVVSYEQLLAAGFRRSGALVYRPYCSACNACQSLRLCTSQFKPSRGQKRISRLNRDLTVMVSEENKPEYYPLYQRYIHQRHADGSMFPPSQGQYNDFLRCHWLTPRYLELRLNNRLLAVAVTDQLPNALSAMYTFYDPDDEARSLGSYAILCQLALAKQSGREWLYLGYFVNDCQKMRYKHNYLPHERFIAGKWKIFDRKSE